jgi:hypothetical protein
MFSRPSPCTLSARVEVFFEDGDCVALAAVNTRESTRTHILKRGRCCARHFLVVLPEVVLPGKFAAAAATPSSVWVDRCARQMALKVLAWLKLWTALATTEIRFCHIRCGLRMSQCQMIANLPYYQSCTKVNVLVGRTYIHCSTSSWGSLHIEHK